MVQINKHKLSLIDRICYKYVIKNRYTKSSYKINVNISQDLKQIRFRAMFWAAVTATIAILLYYIPINYFSSFFGRHYKTRFWNYNIEVPLISIGYNIICIVLEILILTYINLRMTMRISSAIGYPQVNDENSEFHFFLLSQLAQEKNIKAELQLGLNPYEKTTKWMYISILLWSKAKATVTAFIFKIIFRKLLGRYVIRIFTDISAIPIFAFWNSYATFNIYSQLLIRAHSHKLVLLYLNDLNPDVIFKIQHLIYDCLQYIAIQKKSFNENHYLFSIQALNYFYIKPKSKHVLEKNFELKIRELDYNCNCEIIRFMLLGMLLDGTMNRREKIALLKVSKCSIINVSKHKQNLFFNFLKAGKNKVALEVLKRMAH